MLKILLLKKLIKSLLSNVKGMQGSMEGWLSVNSATVLKSNLQFLFSSVNLE